MKKKLNKCLEVFPKNKEKVRKNLCQFNLIKEKKTILNTYTFDGNFPPKNQSKQTVQI